MRSTKYATLRRVSPLTFWISWVFVFVNFIIGPGMFSYHPTTPYIIIQGFFSFAFWGCVFTGLGIVGAIGLLINNWHMIRATLVAGLSVKTLWLVALIFRATNGGAIPTLGVWAALMLTQLALVIYFPDE